MGTYVPSGKRRRRSIAQALQEAEQEHFLDCPNADLRTRAGALVVDAILFWLLWTGIHHSCLALGKYTDLWFRPFFQRHGFSDPLFLSQELEVGFQGSLIFLYLIWTVHRFGASPGKLLLGLRIGNAENGAKLSFPAVFFREIIGKLLSTLLGGAGWILPLFREDRRSLHDLISGSVVKRTRDEP